jgi:hypothetical protein
MKKEYFFSTTHNRKLLKINKVSSKNVTLSSIFHLKSGKKEKKCFKNVSGPTHPAPLFRGLG